MPKPGLVRVSITLRKGHVIRLDLLRAALSEKMEVEMTLSELVEKIIDDFLESK